MSKFTYLNQFLRDHVDTNEGSSKVNAVGPTTDDDVLTYILEQQNLTAMPSYFKNVTDVHYTNFELVEFQAVGMGQYLTKVMPFLEGKWGMSDESFLSPDTRNNVQQLTRSILQSQDAGICLRNLDSL